MENTLCKIIETCQRFSSSLARHLWSTVAIAVNKWLQSNYSYGQYLQLIQGRRRFPWSDSSLVHSHRQVSNEPRSNRHSTINNEEQLHVIQPNSYNLTSNLRCNNQPIANHLLDLYRAKLWMLWWTSTSSVVLSSVSHSPLTSIGNNFWMTSWQATRAGTLVNRLRCSRVAAEITRECSNLNCFHVARQLILHVHHPVSGLSMTPGLKWTFLMTRKKLKI